MDEILGMAYEKIITAAIQRKVDDTLEQMFCELADTFDLKSGDESPGMHMQLREAKEIIRGYTLDWLLGNQTI